MTTGQITSYIDHLGNYTHFFVQVTFYNNVSVLIGLQFILYFTDILKGFILIRFFFRWP